MESEPVVAFKGQQEQQHHTIRRKPGHPTSGMAYLGLHDSAGGAEAARQANITKPWSGIKKIDGRKVGLSEKDAAEITQEWLDSTEVIELVEGQEYNVHSFKDGTFGIRNHGKDDGTHGSVKK